MTRIFYEKYVPEDPLLAPLFGNMSADHRLFRHRDRQSMKFAFDLWSYDDVKQNAHPILERVRNGSMLCDGAWPPENVDAFERWVTTGMRP